ncbi:hypothetical protein BD414DRAFT_509717 [Trametes punicea]|nr:hypothetical protein BD414DRAFT_509717 [Trametes punicea]
MYATGSNDVHRANSTNSLESGLEETGIVYMYIASRTGSGEQEVKQREQERDLSKDAFGYHVKRKRHQLEEQVLVFPSLYEMAWGVTEERGLHCRNCHFRREPVRTYRTTEAPDIGWFTPSCSYGNLSSTQYWVLNELGEVVRHVVRPAGYSSKSSLDRVLAVTAQYSLPTPTPPSSTCASFHYATDWRDWLKFGTGYGIGWILTNVTEEPLEFLPRTSQPAHQ